MIICTDIKNKIKTELLSAKAIWIATAMISHKGWEFIQSSLPVNTDQHFLIGIDLATEPKVFEAILNNLQINARIYQTAYTFHPKVYIIQKKDNSLTAFIGSSNTTSWGLEKNIEMNFQVTDQDECTKLLQWFNEYYNRGYIITEDFLESYKTKFNKVFVKNKEIIIDINGINNEISKDKGQFFSRNHHKIFEKKYHRVESKDLKQLRKEVSEKFKELNKIIYPQFKSYGLNDLHCHHNPREIVSRHFFNPFSGKYINAIWLHYGKSYDQLQSYKRDQEKSFINNIRLQVIINENSIGIWLVLGKDWGSIEDRNHFRESMKNPEIQNAFFNAYKNLDGTYSINVSDMPNSKEIKTSEDLYNQTQKETIEDYFIIGSNIDWLDDRLSNKNISNTILTEFKKLYPLYEIMKHG
ncbi:phospholipase D-like domain-containing protein [Flavobacterium sp. AJR]|uniref:phospholipase D-like domain-containing protein n=1 Tax=Flavobacterium sp. AJR TaxID=1979369 RepID=UPI000A3D7FA6|nr:phospholipase D-like domain-containing protein [Flavobacterium sp. AJR]OUL60049.1 hypothetical protein B8T70_22385 [Flavobacterium sp. AJR]